MFRWLRSVGVVYKLAQALNLRQYKTLGVRNSCPVVKVKGEFVGSLSSKITLQQCDVLGGKMEHQETVY